MQPETDPNTFTQKDLMQHLLHASQHTVTREEMAAQFTQAEVINKERFEQSEKHSNQRFEQAEKHNNQRFDQVDIKFNKLTEEIQGQGKKHDRLTWALFAGMLAIFFKDYIVKLFAA